MELKPSDYLSSTFRAPSSMVVLRSILISLCAALLAGTAFGASNDSQLTKDERMAWWRDAEFGMFIHWGPYAVPAGVYQDNEIEGIGEWIMNNANIPIAEYEAYARQFNPTKFDATEWVRLAKESGMEYLVITAKHHDGFCIWPTEFTNYNIVDFTAFDRDPLQELATACREEGLTFGLYYSIIDWHHPQAQAYFEPNYNDRSGKESSPEFQSYIDDYMKPQLQELIDRYQPSVLWFDGDWIKDWNRERGADLYHYVLGLKPDIIVNNRVGVGRGGSMEGLTQGEGHVGDFGTPEQQVPEEGLPGVDWESCITINDTWGYKSTDENWKSVEQLWEIHQDVTRKGGNLLLNVGPTKDGEIPRESVVRLKALGKRIREVADNSP